MNIEPIEVNEIDGIWPFLKSVDWNEPWLQGVLGFHGFVAAITYLTRKHMNVQIGLFLLYLSIVYFGEYINEQAARHWRSYSTQQYFDSNGLFISVILLGPLLINCLVIVVIWLYGTFDLMVKVKRAQIREKSKDASNHSTQDDDAEPVEKTDNKEKSD